MKWVLVILTFWRPDVTVSQVEMEFATEQDCLDQQYVFEEKFARDYEAGSGFGWMLYCKEKGVDDEGED